MKRYLFVILFVISFSLVITDVVLAEDGVTDAMNGGEIALLLTPLVAAAAAIERVLEMIFDYYESLILSLSKIPGLGTEYVKWAQERVKEAHEKLMKEGSGSSALQDMERSLQDAKDRLTDYLKSEFYTSRKRAISLIVGLVLGVLLGFVGEIKMFALLGLGLPKSLEWVDMLITGLVIGTGSAPVHSLIGILQKSKDAVDEAASLWKGKAINEITDLLQSTIRAREQGTGDERKQISEVELQRIAERLLK